MKQLTKKIIQNIGYDVIKFKTWDYDLFLYSKYYSKESLSQKKFYKKKKWRLGQLH